MSSKWRALQHRHHYTYSSIVFPSQYLSSLHNIPSPKDPIAQNFIKHLTHLTSLTSTYAQVNHVKNLATAFGELGSVGDKDLVSGLVRFYLEVLFMENSLPLHKGLVAGLAKAGGGRWRGVIGGCLRGLCEEYGEIGNEEEEGKRGRTFCVGRVALLMMGTPRLGYLVEAVEGCLGVVVLDVVEGLRAVVRETEGWARRSPVVMEQCQEALSCLYYLLQRFPDKFLENSGLNLLESVFEVVLGVFKSPAFSRDCFVAAGVSLCAALQVCLSPEELGYYIMSVVLNHQVCYFNGKHEIELSSVVTNIPYSRDLSSELKGFSALSRLCLIRGIVTVLPRSVLNIQFLAGKGGLGRNGFVGSMPRTILYDGILPELCNYCENPTDSHFNFHAVTVMQICLQQVKASMLVELDDKTADFDPLPENMSSRLLRIIWNNLEDPLSQTVKQVHLIFDLLLDVSFAVQLDSNCDRTSFSVSKIAGNILRMGLRCKGRYVPLASLTRRLGAKAILAMRPQVLFETVQAYIDDDVCCVATSFLKCFLEHLRDECWSSDGVNEGYRIYRTHCLPPVLLGLSSGVPKLRSNLNTYALPILLQVDVDSIFPLLAFLSIRVGEDTEMAFPELSSLDVTLTIEEKVAVLVSLLKVCRFLALLEGDMDSCETPFRSLEEQGKEYNTACFRIKGLQVKVPAEWLALALTHVDESLRVDAAEAIFLNPKTSSLPSHLELHLMRKALPMNMRCSSTAFLMKWNSLFKKFFSRVHTALERQKKQGNWLPVSVHSSVKNCSVNACETNVVSQAEALFHFMKWLSLFLFLSCYPSAPYERKIIATELILTLINVWSIVPSLPDDNSLYPYNRGLTSPESTLLLVGSVIDSWDRLRENSFKILLKFPTPLPGISDPLMVEDLVSWAKRLVCSPRVRESDAGALAIRLILRKYVVELGWIVRVSNDSVSCKTASVSPVVVYVTSLIDWLRVFVEEGEKNLSEACKNSFVHGALLTLRYAFEELDWNSDIDASSIMEVRHALGILLELIMRITSLALWVVAADAWYLPEDADDGIDDDSLLLDLPSETDESESTTEHKAKALDSVSDPRSLEQIVMVGCWLAMKEVSLLLATIVRKIPLPSAASTLGDAAELLTPTSGAILDLKQLESIGQHFLEVILKMKHNGAIDKTRAGFTALCHRLLFSDNPRLCQLTESWMEQLMDRMVAKGQTVDDLLRRSAGIPAAFSAFFLSEPEGAPKKLLPRALRWMIDVARKPLLDEEVEPFSMNDKLCKSSASLINQESILVAPSDGEARIIFSKDRDEGVIPTVHAFNVLRAAFNDTNLATDTSGFVAEAMIVSIRSFSSPHWEVRNGASLAYTALLRRVIGFLNVQKRESARRVLTGLEFFHRYPTLHSFIFSELKLATELLCSDMSGSNLASVVHPSLCPVLILLSRLKPSPIAGEADDHLDPFLFMPFIMKCSTQSNLRLRVLASRASTGLISNERLQETLVTVASELPFLGKQSETRLAFVEPCDSKDISSSVNYNAIHGMLLLLINLLDTNCRNMADMSTKNLILDHLIKVLIRCSWIGRPSHCRCPVLNGSFLKVLDHMFCIARTYESNEEVAICTLLFDLSAGCLAVEVSNRSLFHDPTISELRKQAVVSYFSCVIQKSEEAAERVLPSFGHSHDKTSKRIPIDIGFVGVVEQLIRLMSDASYEVRLATFKWLFQFIKSSEVDDVGDNQSSRPAAEIMKWAETSIQMTMMELLSQETYHNCSYYILRIISAWNFLQNEKVSSGRVVHSTYVGTMIFESATEFWNCLISLHDHARHTKTREALVCCLGFCIKHFTGLLKSIILDETGKQNAVECGNDLARCTFLYDCIIRFVRLIKQLSASSEPVNMRKATAESMVVSGLLGEAKLIASSVTNSLIPPGNSVQCFEPNNSINMLACQILEVWFMCIQLLEDEDVFLREKLSLDVLKCFGNASGSSSKAGTLPVPAQVDKVLELSFEFLSSVFGHWDVYLEYLSAWVLKAVSFDVPRGDLVRRVFDKEIDNYHEEKLLLCQICCSHLEKLQVSRMWAFDASRRELFLGFLKTWRSRFCQQFLSFASAHAGVLSGVGWFGGVGNHKDAFMPVYANLLAVYALSNCIFNGETGDASCLLFDVVEVGKSAKPYLKNPLICNMYIVLVKLHEKAGGNVAASVIDELLDGCQLWDEFNPYFLLR
ncbi:hypothetical protein Drorol1_Dr00020468 [Drosera rotundifolia]